MTSKRAVAVLFAVQLIASVALAQDVTSSEFGRVTADQVELTTKHSAKLSGSLGMSLSKSNGGPKSFDGTLGGTLLKDRLWFFASAQQFDARLNTGATYTQLPEQAVARTLDAKLMGQVGERQNFIASYQAGRQPFVSATDPFTGVVPTSFLSLRYMGVVSNNMFFNASFTQQSAKQP